MFEEDRQENEEEIEIVNKTNFIPEVVISSPSHGPLAALVATVSPLQSSIRVQPSLLIDNSLFYQNLFISRNK